MVSPALLQIGYQWLDRGRVPDFIIRIVSRALIRERLREIDHGSYEANHAAKMRFIDDIRGRDIAEDTDKANNQHYEVSTNFWRSALGPHLKYSASIFHTGRETLGEAERLMLESYCPQAHLADGQDILDLGCGWGCLSLFLAERYPNARITGLSNSATQKLHIDGEAERRGLTNLEIITADLNTFDFEPARSFDRIISLEMFEHMKNYDVFFAKVSSWLRPASTPRREKKESLAVDPEDQSLLFVQIICNRTMPYHFEDGWMAENFFSGGMFPSHDLYLYFQSDLTLLQSWYIPGAQYARTLSWWLRNLDQNAAEVMKDLKADVVAKGQDASLGSVMFYRWRVYFIACYELFKMDRGQRWGIGQYIFKRADA